jgi:hypothetical protein
MTHGGFATARAWLDICVRVARRLCVCGLLLCGLGLAVADATSPPPRPIEISKAPPIPAPGLGSAQTPPPSGRQPVDVDVQSLQPYNLPPASREKMRACGEQWRSLKLAGQATGLTWRLFAEKCLVK